MQLYDDDDDDNYNNMTCIYYFVTRRERADLARTYFFHRRTQTRGQILRDCCTCVRVCAAGSET